MTGKEPRIYFHKRLSRDQCDEIELVHGDERHRFQIPHDGILHGCEVGTPNRFLKIIQSREIVIVLKGCRVYRAPAHSLARIAHKPSYIIPIVKDITVWG